MFTVFIATAEFMATAGMILQPKTILKTSDNLSEDQKKQLEEKKTIFVTQTGIGGCKCPFFKQSKDYLMFRTGSPPTYRAMPLELSKTYPRRAASQLRFYCQRGPR